MDVDEITEDSLIGRVGRLRSTLLILTILGILVLIYFEIDSYSQRMQLRDAQRRIAIIEQQCK